MAFYRIADLLIEMNTSGRTELQARPYLTDEDGKADMTVRSNAAELHKTHSYLSEDDCEYLATGSNFYRQLVAFDGMMLHASCVVVEDRAYLFSAPCGTGKSTHVKLWMKLFGERAYVLNDDKPALRVIDGKVYAYGTPWSGKFDFSRNARVELGGIAVVKRAAENSIRRLPSDEALFALMNQTVRPSSDKIIERYLTTMQNVVETGKIFELSCNMDISAARLSYETMSGKRFEA